MPERMTLPPPGRPRTDGLYPGGWWHEDAESGRVVCDLCPRECRLKPGDRGFCFVRQNVGGELMLTTFGKSTGFCIDPIEKKPLNHFYPGTSVLSFGTAGCNLGCKFCQNWDISKSREVARLSENATPDAIARAAVSLGCRSVAFTYNDPVVWAEYAIETARACHSAGVKTVAVTAGYITPEARGPFFQFMDAANVDLKGFTEEFYQHVTYSHLQPVLDTLAWLKAETDVWFEITNLVIPQGNDSDDEIRRMSEWVLDRCGDKVPIHFTAFHPDFRMRDRPATPHETLLRAYDLARGAGLKHVYVGNVHDARHQATYCAGCGKTLVERNWYELGAYHLRGGRCGHCGAAVAGRFDDRPGDWGRKRVPVDIARFGAGPEPQVITIAPVSPAMKTTDPTETRGPAATPGLSDVQKAEIHSAACDLVAGAVLGRAVGWPDPTLAGTAEVPIAGAFVTLKRRGQLRGCCGSLGEPRPLLAVLREAASRTARDDPRLPPVSATELPYLDLDVNLLSPRRRVDARGRGRLAAVQVGRHGLRIERAGGSGLLLPGVAVENGWDAETFLRQTCRKAGLPTTAWENDDTSLFTFETTEFDGAFDTRSLGPDDLRPPGVSPGVLSEASEYARANVAALVRGMTPEYYRTGFPDGNVAGLALTLIGPGAAGPRHLVQISLRPGVPFQATLFGLCEAAARSVGPAGVPPRVGLSVFTDPAMHGTVAEPDLRGLDPARRALLLTENDTLAWVFDPSAGPDDLVDTVRAGVDLLSPARAGLYSLEVRSTEPRVVFRPGAGAEGEAGGVRPAAQAGRFYPSDPSSLASQVDGLLARTERRPEPWAAAMVPHAGLAYSGAVAAAVFQRLEVPGLVLVIGPKHTRPGAEWAVAPHDAWAIPGATVASDPALARALAATIPGLCLDAEAHRQEHAVEVELPFLARLAPRSRVVGLAVGHTDLEGCLRFARGLAGLIRGLPTRPLLLISSDMNHFADDRETRRLDETALTAMQRRDPAHLLETVATHNISMCGVLPAVIVMETLRLLGGLTVCERVAYATSGDASGDRSRVVGYAGVLLG